MSEKRFYLTEDGIQDKEYEFSLLGESELVDIINRIVDENEQLREYIDTIFDGNTHICEYIDIEDVKFYCTMNKLYCDSTCTYCKCYDEKNMVNLGDRIREVVE